MSATMVFSKECSFRQQMLLGLCILYSIICILFLWFQFSSSMLFLTFLSFLITFLLNHFLSKFYEITIEKEAVTVKNMWRIQVYPLNELADIALTNFFYPHPFTPNLKFTMKDGKQFFTTMPNRFKQYFSAGGIKKYIADLKAQLIQ